MPNPTQTTESQSRPQRAGFKPATGEETRGELLIAGICLAGFLLGLGANIYGSLNGLTQTASQSLTAQPSSYLVLLLVFYLYPLFLVASLYYFWHVWDRRRKTVRFLKFRVHGDAVITHLWKIPPSGSGKKYYLGYLTSSGISLYAEVAVSAYKRLKVGDNLPVDYLADDPAVCCPALERVTRAKPA